MSLDFSVNPPTATKVWEYRLVQEDLITPAYGPFVGDADRLPNGNTIISEGPTGLIVEVDSAPLYAELKGFRCEEIRQAMNERLGGRKLGHISFRPGRSRSRSPLNSRDD